jgi:thioredoxin-like negative regulator of GroEL
MITISGLTPRQKTIMDMLWSCQTLEQAQQLIRSLPTKQDAQDAQSLVAIATMESLEEDGYLDQFEAAANEAIRSCR